MATTQMLTAADENLDEALGAVAPEFVAAVRASDPDPRGALAYHLDQLAEAGVDPVDALQSIAHDENLVDEDGELNADRVDWLVANLDSVAGWLASKVRDYTG